MADLIRTFVAIELSTDLLSALKAEQQRLRGEILDRSVRWTNPAGVHLTLKFLGDTPVERVPEIKAAITQACRGIAPFEIAAAGLGCFPNVRRPAVLWVGVRESGNRLTELWNQIERTVSPLGFASEARPFHPHLTLARIDRAAADGIQRQVSHAASQGAGVNLGTMTVDQVALMRSELKPGGSLYTRLFAAKLAGTTGC